jgi:N-acetylglucosamine malate deacetylase 2
MKTVVGIFAHPDDEALGPAGTLATLAKDHEVYLLCATNGDANGKTNAEKEAIGEVRKEELRSSARVLGIKNVFFLEYRDGELCNSTYHQLAAEIQKKLEELRPEVVITFEPHGVSGHIDHITVSMVTSYLFDRLSFIKKAMYYCLTAERAALMKDYFIYFPEGYTKDQIHETVNIEAVWDQKVQAMHCHKSQMHDVETVLDQTKNFPREEHFLVKSKDTAPNTL